LVAMATSLNKLENMVQIHHLYVKHFHTVVRLRNSQHSHKYLPFGEKIVKIGPVDHEIALLNLKKKKEINASKIYSPVGRFAERAKLLITAVLSSPTPL